MMSLCFPAWISLFFVYKIERIRYYVSRYIRLLLKIVFNQLDQSWSLLVLEKNSVVDVRDIQC